MKNSEIIELVETNVQIMRDALDSKFYSIVSQLSETNIDGLRLKKRLTSEWIEESQLLEDAYAKCIKDLK